MPRGGQEASKHGKWTDSDVICMCNVRARIHLLRTQPYINIINSFRCIQHKRKAMTTEYFGILFFDYMDVCEDDMNKMLNAQTETETDKAFWKNQISVFATHLFTPF